MAKSNQLFIKIDNFKGGTATLINPARLDPKFAVESVNLIQEQDGIWRTRPGINYYGQAISGASNIDGIAEYVKSDGTRELIAVAGGYAWKSVDGGSWIQLTGATFTSGVKPVFLQIKNNLYISNGQDSLAYYNGTSLNTFTAISAPTGLAGTLGSGLSSGSINNYYRVVAVNNVGFTTPSLSINVTTNKDRKFWNPNATNPEVVNLTWNAVTGATGYQIYHGYTDGNETLIGTSSVASFQDRGEAETPKNEYVETPDDNTTGAPKFKSMEISNNILWGTYDANNPWRVYWSGTGQYLGYFSPFYGGGYVDIELGGRNVPYNVVHYRSGKGDPITTVLTSSRDGKGAIFQIELTSVAVGETTIIVPAVYKIVGSIGTDAPFATAKVGDNIIYVNKTGVFALRNKPQMFNVLSTDNLIQPIRNKWEAINQNNVTKVVSYYKYPRLFISFSQGTTNDTTAIFDTERNNWNWAWNVGFNGFTEYTQSDGTTKFLGILPSGNRLVEISDNFNGDFGQPFYQSYISPIIPVDKDLTILSKIREVIFELGKFTGTVYVEVLGITKKKQVSSLSSKTISSTVGTSGWGDDFFSDFLFSDTNDVPAIFSFSTIKKRLKINKKIYALQFKIYTTAKAYFEILSVQAKGTIIPARAPSLWN